MTLTNGVAIGVYGAYGADLGTGVTILSQGTPNRLNVFCRYNAVQELTNGYASPTGLFRLASCPTTRPVLRFRFTDFAMLGGTDAERTVINTTPYFLSELSLRDSAVRGGRVNLYPAVSGGAGYSVLFAMTNNLVERGEVNVLKQYWGTAVNLTAQLRNNLFCGGAVTLVYDQDGTYNPAWTVRENHFDTVNLQQTGTGVGNITTGFNGYRSTTSIGGVSNVTLTAWSYAAPTNGLGRWYHGMTNLANCGSRNADTAALYHFTTQAGQAKETNSVVDIGFHYVATDASGLPQDFDGDTAPDYLEDANGNGTADAGEFSWQSYNSPGGLGASPGLTVYTLLPQ